MKKIDMTVLIFVGLLAAICGYWLGLPPLTIAILAVALTAVGSGSGWLVRVRGMGVAMIRRLFIVAGIVSFSFGLWFVTANTWKSVAGSPWWLPLITSAVAATLFMWGGWMGVPVFKKLLIWGNTGLLLISILAIFAPTSYHAISSMAGKMVESGRTHLVDMERSFLPTVEQSFTVTKEEWQHVAIHGDATWLTPSARLVFVGNTINPPAIEWCLSTQQNIFISRPARGSREVVIEPFRSVDLHTLRAGRDMILVRLSSSASIKEWASTVRIEEVDSFVETIIVPLKEGRGTKSLSAEFVYVGDEVKIIGFARGEPKSLFRFYTKILKKDLPTRWFTITGEGHLVFINLEGVATKVVVKVKHDLTRWR